MCLNVFADFHFNVDAHAVPFIYVSTITELSTITEGYESITLPLHPLDPDIKLY